MPGPAQLEMDALFQGEIFVELKAVGKLVNTMENVLPSLFGHIRKAQCVRQERLKEGIGGMGAEDFAFEAVMDKLRDAADMIDMGVGQKQKINIPRRNRPAGHGRNLIPALGHTAVHKNVEPLTLQQMTGTGDGMLTAKMREMHGEYLRCQLKDERVKI